MTGTEQKIIEFIGDKALIETGDKILVAFSGGPDSVFLLNFLHKFKKKYKTEIGAFHLNHKLRGINSDKDEEFCRNFCEGKRIPFFSYSVNIRKEASLKKISIEEAGRNARYNYLEKTAVDKGFTKIATGHNLDDNTETILLNLFKGTGISGIAGIPFNRGKIIRPLLGTPKAEILSFLEKHGIPFIKDKSNTRDDYERNFIRNRILPLVRKRINPSVDEALLRSSEILKEYSRFIGRKTGEAAGYVLDKGEGIKINLRRFHIIDKELKGNVLRELIERNFNVSLTFKDIKSLLLLSESEPGKSLVLRENIKASRDRSYLVINSGEEPEIPDLNLCTGEKVKIDGKIVSAEEWKGEIKYSGSKREEFIDGDRSGDEFIIRKWKPGDKFKPIGMKGTVKVSDFLNSVKIPSSEKGKNLVLTNSKEIIWVIGYRISENFKIKKSTRRVLKLCLM